MKQTNLNKKTTKQDRIEQFNIDERVSKRMDSIGKYFILCNVEEILEYEASTNISLAQLTKSIQNKYPTSSTIPFRIKRIRNFIKNGQIKSVLEFIASSDKITSNHADAKDLAEKVLKRLPTLMEKIAINNRW